jgi:hypothetical protein
MGAPSFAASAKGGGLDPRQHNISLRRRTRSPPREARRPHHALSRSVPKRNRAQPILECGGSAAAFPKPPAPRSTQREAPPRFSHHPKTAVILRSVFRDEESHPCPVPHPSPSLRRVGVLIQRHHRISFLTKMHRPPREARRPPRALLRSVRTPRSAQTTMECGGSAAAFPKDARATIDPARSAATILAPPKNRRHSEERLSRRRISSMLRRPDHYDQVAPAKPATLESFLGGRSFSSDINNGAQRLPLARPSRASLRNVQAQSLARSALRFLP